MQPSNTGPVRPVLEEEPSPRSRWQAAGAVALALVLLIVVLLVLGRDGAVEETTVAISVSTTPTAATTTTLAPTTTIVPQIVAFLGVAHPVFEGSLVAVSAGEVWAVMNPGDLIGHLEDGVWAYWHLITDAVPIVQGLAVAPDGAVWAATQVGVFSFDGAEWTRWFDGPAGGVTVDGGGSVWIGGWVPAGPLLARLDGEAWERVDSSAGAWGEGGWRGAIGEVEVHLSTVDPVLMAALPDGGAWIAGTDLMRYDGATLEAVPTEFCPDPCVVFGIESAPSGDLWVWGEYSFGEWWEWEPVLVRFDGEAWTPGDWPFPPGNYSAFDLAVEPHGVVWLASSDGLESSDGTEWTLRIEEQSVFAVDVAPDGAVWYADDYGVHTLTP
jgi:hypothetical protein